MAEAARMIEDGVATAEDIDKATRYGFGFRFAAIGVVEFIDAMAGMTFSTMPVAIWLASSASATMHPPSWIS
jgi:3-hydroxyacyl-CoA dehydrogenase